MNKVIWFTGFSGAGKSTLALHLSEKLKEQHHKVSIIDGDQLRQQFNDLGFSNEGENTVKLTNLDNISTGAYVLLLNVDGKMISNKRISIVK